MDAVLGLNEHMMSLDMPIASEGGVGKSLAEAVADKNAVNPEDALTAERLHECLIGCLNELSDKHREVLSRRFGIGGYERQTLEEVGEAVGLTRERVRQIQVEALRRLREILEKEFI